MELKKYNDEANNKIVMFPTVAECLSDADVYKDAEKYYYNKSDKFPEKYKTSLTDIAWPLSFKGDERDLETMKANAVPCEEDDEYFTNKLKEIKAANGESK